MLKRPISVDNFERPVLANSYFSRKGVIDPLGTLRPYAEV